MSSKSQNTDLIYTFLLAYTAEEMKDLPDLMRVHQGVDIRVDLGHIIGGWELVWDIQRNENVVVAVWFMKLTDGTYARMAA